LKTYFFIPLFLLCTCAPPPRDASADAPFSSTYRVDTIGILVYDGVNTLDVLGPQSILAADMESTTLLIGTQAGPVTTTSGVVLQTDRTIDEVDRLDILVVPGGFRGTILAAYDEPLHDWIRMIDSTTVFTSAVCTGGWILGGAGLLEGKRATTNWYRAEEKLAGYGAEFTAERYTRDGKLWTSAGVTAGMDMSLAILGEIRGEAYAQAVMLDMEYDPQPPYVGGRVDNTPPEVYKMMDELYTSGVEPLVDSLERR
jgi:transcriptional regulator GlxA family with amidase domain